MNLPARSMAAPALASASSAPGVPADLLHGLAVRPPRMGLSLIHISEPTRQAENPYAALCLKKKQQYSKGCNYSILCCSFL